MKSLSLLLLAVLLGGGLLLLTMGGERAGRRAPGHEPSVPAPEASTTAEAPLEATQAVPGPGPKSAVERPSGTARGELRRESVDGGPARAPRIVYEGAVIAEGNPLPEADVSLSANETVLAETRTDERGRFRLSLPAHPEAMQLFLRARGFVGLERALPARPAGGTELLGNLRLVRGAMLLGRVVEEGGRGIAGARVRVEPQSPGRDLLSARAVTKADGSFEMPDAPRGGVVVRASAAGFGERSVNHIVREGNPVVVELAPGLELSARLVTPRGAPVAGAEVSLLAVGSSRVPARKASSDSEGRVHFRDLGAEVWNLRVAHPDYRPTGKNQIRTGQVEETLQCIPWPALEGRITAPDGSPPPANTLVQAMPAAAPGDRFSALTGGSPIEPDGRFRIGGLRPGDWTVRITAPGFAPTQSPTIRLGIEGDGWAGTISLDGGGELRLELLRAGEPVPDAAVEIASREPTLAQLWALQDSEGVMGQRIQAVDGRAHFNSLPPGAVWTMVFAEGSPPSIAGPFQVASGRTLEKTLELALGARARGRARAPDGSPYPEAQIRIIDRAGRLGFPLTVVPDGAGGYVTPWLPPGRFSVEAFSIAEPSRRSGAHEVDLEAGQTLDLDLSL